MACKCRICGIYDVDKPGDICGICALNQPAFPPVQLDDEPKSDHAGGESKPAKTGTAYPGRGRGRRILVNTNEPDIDTDPYGNPIIPADDDPVTIYAPGQAPATGSSGGKSLTTQTTSSGHGNGTSSVAGGLTSGIVKNIVVDTQKTFLLQKIFRTLFAGVPYSLDDEITMFRVYPDYSGTAVNAMGYACDQVIVYGKMNAGAIAENNNVEVYGHRDSRNNIVADRIFNKATGTVVTPYRVASPIAIWCVTLALIALIFYVATSVSFNSIISIIILIFIILNLPLILKILVGILGLLLFRRR